MDIDASGGEKEKWREREVCSDTVTVVYKGNTKTEKNQRIRHGATDLVEQGQEDSKP